MAPAMCIVPAYSTGDWLGKGLSASVVHRVSALAQRSISVLQVCAAFLAMLAAASSFRRFKEPLAK